MLGELKDRNETLRVYTDDLRMSGRLNCVIFSKSHDIKLSYRLSDNSRSFKNRK